MKIPGKGKINYFKLLIYVSIVFLIYSLYRADYLIIPEISSYSYLVLAFVFLWLGFIIDGMSWWLALKTNGYKLPLRFGIAAQGLPVFGKYIPGKLWTIMGRAEYIATKFDIPRKELNLLSLSAQFASILSGLILGSFSLIFIPELRIYSLGIGLLVLFLSLILFTRVFHNLAEKTLNLLKIDIKIPQISLHSLLWLLPMYFLDWLSWSIGFYFLSVALFPFEVPFIAGLGFSMAACLGVLTLIAPGGIGVREGVLGFYLAACGVPVAAATSIAISSRLWFLIGEIFIFILSTFLNRKNNLNES